MERIIDPEAGVVCYVIVYWKEHECLPIEDTWLTVPEGTGR
jgi:hypothetical protein